MPGEAPVTHAVKLVVRLPYLKWREGRPRWEPNAALMKAGWRGQDLRRADGAWFSLDEAAAWVRERMAEVAARRAPVRPPRRQGPQRLSLARLVDMWTREIEQTLAEETKLGRPHERAPKTVRDYAGKLRWLLRFDGEIAAAEAAALTPVIVEDLVRRMRLATSDHMANSVVRVMRILYVWAGKRELVRPVKGDPFHKLGLKTPEPDPVCRSPEEIRAMVAAADALDLPAIGDAILLGVWTGQRQGDRLALQETAFRGNGGRIVFQQRKTRARVAVPPAAELVQRLDAMRARRRARNLASPFVVLNEATGQPYNEHTYRHLVARVRAHAATTTPGLADFRDKDLRSTAVTWLALAGCTIEEVRAITGHSRATVLSILDHYMAEHDAFGSEAIRKLEEWYASNAG